jgi:uncharacterized protein YdeI (YjbR/CyaY-like superfamily)
MKAFKTQADFRRWLGKHHDSETELMMRLFKVHARNRGIGYREALDEALCWGWIDGVKRSHDEDSFLQRFTPRKKKSNWSAVNVKRYHELDAAKLVAPPGRAAFERWDGKLAPYSFLTAQMTLAPVFEKQLRAHKRAWSFWEALPPGYKRLMVYRVMSAKREETRVARFANLIEHAKRGERLPLIKPPTTSKPKRGSRGAR